MVSARDRGDRRAEGPAPRRRARAGARHAAWTSAPPTTPSRGCATSSPQGRRIMGFGHRVYKVRDPRAEVLRTVAEEMSAARARATASCSSWRAQVEQTALARARRGEAGPQPADQRRVLHRARAAVAGPAAARRSWRMFACGRVRRLVRARDRAARRGPPDPAAVRVRRRRCGLHGSGRRAVLDGMRRAARRHGGARRARGCSSAGRRRLVLYPPVPTDLGWRAQPRCRVRATCASRSADARRARRLVLCPANRAPRSSLFHGFGRDHHRRGATARSSSAPATALLAVDFRSSRAASRMPTTLGHHEIERRARGARVAAQRSPGSPACRSACSANRWAVPVGRCSRRARPDVAALVVDGAFATAAGRSRTRASAGRGLPRQPSATILRRLGPRADRCRSRRAATPVDAAAPRSRDRPVLPDPRLGATTGSRPAQPRALWTAAGAKGSAVDHPDTGHNEGWLRHRAPYEAARARVLRTTPAWPKGRAVPAGDL